MQALIDTITQYWEAFVNFFMNVITSLGYFLLDLPILIFEKIFDAAQWLFEWASQDTLGSVGLLVLEFQNGLNSLSPTIFYALQMSEFQDCLAILSGGVSIWTAFKIIGFIKAIL